MIPIKGLQSSDELSGLMSSDYLYLTQFTTIIKNFGGYYMCSYFEHLFASRGAKRSIVESLLNSYVNSFARWSDEPSPDYNAIEHVYVLPNDSGSPVRWGVFCAYGRVNV